MRHGLKKQIVGVALGFCTSLLLLQILSGGSLSGLTVVILINTLVLGGAMAFMQHRFFTAPLAYRLNERAVRAIRRRDFPEAIDAASRALARDDTFAWAYLNRAIGYLNTGQPEPALTDLNQALILDPNMENIYFVRGHVHAALRHKEQALQDLNEAIHRKFQPSEAYAARAAYYIQQREYSLAEADLKEALRHKQMSPRAFVMMAILYDKKGNAVESEKWHQRAISKAPSESYLYNSRAWQRSIRGDLDAAFHDVDIALQLDTKSSNAYDTRGHTLFLMGRFDEALQDYVRAYELSPESKSALAGQAVCYHAIGKPGEARTLWRQLIDMDARYASAEALVEDFHPAEDFVREARKLVGGLKNANRLLNGESDDEDADIQPNPVLKNADSAE